MIISGGKGLKNKTPCVLYNVAIDDEISYEFYKKR
jgi:hypothetical protein